MLAENITDRLFTVCGQRATAPRPGGTEFNFTCAFNRALGTVDVEAGPDD